MESVANSPNRYIGLFRPTKPTTKLIQNITQSHEIKFGDALEEIFTTYFEVLGYQNLTKRIVLENNEIYHIDQLFLQNNIIYMIEQKVRDDHDSTKKRGQFQNFENKFFEVSKRYPSNQIMPIMWFVDKSLVKNKNYYLTEMQRMDKHYQCNASLCYGEQLFDNQIIAGINIQIWNELLVHLKLWKDELPEMPEINFDNNFEEVIDEIKEIKPSVIRRLFENENIKNQILPILFPNGETLSGLKEQYRLKNLPIFDSLIKLIDNFLCNYLTK
ncbi:MAG: restriction endonuclease [Firmicutes bacterium]|nr:restriction endonuclease [Bacillota bacterium]